MHVVIFVRSSPVLTNTKQLMQLIVKESEPINLMIFKIKNTLKYILDSSVSNIYLSHMIMFHKKWDSIV